MKKVLKLLFSLSLSIDFTGRKEVWRAFIYRSTLGLSEIGVVLSTPVILSPPSLLAENLAEPRHSQALNPLLFSFKVTWLRFGLLSCFERSSGKE